MARPLSVALFSLAVLLTTVPVWAQDAPAKGSPV